MQGNFRTGNRLALPVDPDKRILLVIENMKKYRDNKDIMLLLTAVINCMGEKHGSLVIDKILLTTMRKLDTLSCDLDNFRVEFLKYVHHKRTLK